MGLLGTVTHCNRRRRGRLRNGLERPRPDLLVNVTHCNGLRRRRLCNGLRRPRPDLLVTGAVTDEDVDVFVSLDVDIFVQPWAVHLDIFVWP